MNDVIELWHDSHVLDGMDILRAECRTYRYDAHAHDFFVIAAFRAGAQKHCIGGARGIALPGTVMVIPPGEVHAGESAARDEGWTYSAFYPSAAALERMSDELFAGSRGSLDFGTAYLIEDKELSNKLLVAADIARGSDDVARRQEAIYQAFAALVQRYGQRSRPTSLRKVSKAPIQRGIDYIMANLDRRLAVDDVAAEAGLSAFHFMRLFKSHTNMTVHQYVVHRRLEAARIMLARGTSPALAAASAGFYDQSHFTCHFKKAFGTTPRRYADACR